MYGKRPELLLWADLRAARSKVTESGIPNCLNYCVSFKVYVCVCVCVFTNVAAGRITTWRGAGWTTMF